MRSDGTRGLTPMVQALPYIMPKRFDTSLFITNLASINTSYMLHHCYEFGTTSVFVCMGV
ncbi:MAG: hypothetical protein RR288_06530 [Oscillibacter sp.]